MGLEEYFTGGLGFYLVGGLTSGEWSLEPVNLKLILTFLNSPQGNCNQSMTTTATASDESQFSQSLCSFLSSQYPAPLCQPPMWL